jgi:tyrosine-protein phosphatase YwqE
VLNWFKKKQDTVQGLRPTTDLHSHLLPGLDDGVQSFEEMEEIVLRFQKLGYTKLITTPHVMSDFYRNTSEVILKKRDEVNTWLANKNINIPIEAAAEYYLDEDLLKKAEEHFPLLTMGDKYLLFETNFLTEPFQLREFIFSVTSQGYKPILAHPERYIYLQDNFEKVEDLLNRGIYFQINLSSISGYYSKGAQRLAHKLIDKGWVHFIGSDCHNLQHIQRIEETVSLKYFQKAISLPILNNTL